jgi:putative colanic acid biosynthesis UDP-glucose lipid carrier transferase
MHGQRKIWGRVVDTVIALCALFCLLPLLLLIAIAIRLTSPGPVFVPGEGSSADGSRFSYYCFRTADIGTSRLTVVGRLLKEYRLDEVPQLWNVLRGHMAFRDTELQRRHL